MALLGILIILFGSNVPGEQASRLYFRKPCTRYLDKTDIKFVTDLSN